MVESAPRVAGILAGNMQNHPATSIKYGLFFEALARQFDVVEICDVSLHGVSRFWNAVQVFHPDLGYWRKRYWQNLSAFRARSKRASVCVSSLRQKVDFVIQISLLFDSAWIKTNIPILVYTDYTAALSAKKPEAGRSPFSPRQLEKWIQLERRAYHRAAHIFTRGKFVRDSLIIDYGISPDVVTAVGGGVSFSSLPEAVRIPDEEAPIALFIGRDFYRKGGDLLLKAFAEVHREYPEAKLLVMTRDVIPDGLPTDGVELLSPAWDREKLTEYFLRANFFILPSRLETWGDVLLEAMAYSLPCIGVREAAMPEIIEDGVTGILVEPEDIDELATAIKKLCEDTALRRNYGLAARERLEKMFTWDHVIELMMPTMSKYVIHS